VIGERFGGLAEELARLQRDQGKDRELTEDPESGFRTLPHIGKR
jgi:hypothetical protein